jgi:hypothetical protein
MNRSLSLQFAVCTALLASAAGCSTTITSGDATTAPSSVSASPNTSVTNTLPGPHPPPTDNNDGTTFDPCLAYTADELKAWGVSPGSVEDLANKPGLQRGCKWSGDGWILQQTVLNRSIDEFLDQDLFPGAQPVTVGGLASAQFHKPADDLTVCFVELPSQKASVGTIVRMNDPQAQRETPDACTKAISIATDTAKKLPK